MSGGRRRKMETMERDARAAGLYSRGLSYRQIMSEMGYRSTASVSDAIRRHLEDTAGGKIATAEARQMQLDRLQDYRRRAWQVIATRHLVTTASGKVALHPDTDEPLIDDAPVLQALDRLARFDEHEARLLGLFAPTKHEVRNIDAIDARLLDLADQVGLGNPSSAEGVPSTA